MRRTLDRRRFLVSGVARGEVLIASTFPHPTRGVVECPAAPVAAAGMARSGLTVKRKPVSAGAGDAILHAVSYVHPSGKVIGLGVAAHRDDHRTVSMAEDIVRTWTKVMRTRRVLLEGTGPSCAGLRREAATVARITGPVAILAPEGGQRDIPFLWPHHDVRIVERLADVPDGTTVVLAAHGVDPNTAAEARARAATGRIGMVDTTCPLVERAHATARRFADDGSTVVVIGDPEHAATRPLASQTPAATVVANAREIDDLAIDPPERVAFVVEPGIAVEDAGVLAAHLRSRVAGTIGQHPDEYCYAASDRRATVRAIASCSELTLVLGTPESADTRTLMSMATAVGRRVEGLGDLGDLRPEWLEPTASVGIIVGTVARPDLAGRLIEVLSGLGPVSVAHRSVTTEMPHATTVFAGARRAG
jgi:4-hydroxy-3-methylbut-2-en-1-yl diphosphate reductase